MSKIRIGINGMGRIGRTVMREFFNRNIEDLEIVACNNPGDAHRYVHLLKYDSVHGVHPADIRLEGNTLSFGDKNIAFFGETDPAKIPWSDHQVDIVIDGTGVIKDKEGLGKHINGTVKKVIMCAPGKDLDGTFVMGINNDGYNPESHNIVSNASCTTNCLAPVAKVINDAFGIENGFMVTVHAYTLDQNILDASHKDLRRARAGAVNMIPTTTGAAKATGLVIPELKGKLDGYSVRVPTADVSMVDLTVNLKKPASVEEINNAIKIASEGSLKDILGFCDLELVSQDYRGRRESSIVDAGMTNVIDNVAKIVTWYDNEVGFSNRVLDLASFMGSKL